MFPDPDTPLGALGELVVELGQKLGDELGKLFGADIDIGPNGRRIGGLITVNLPGSSKINLSAEPSGVVASADGIDRPGILLFIRSSSGDWEGPFAPLCCYGWSRFERSGHAGAPGGDIVIQVGIKAWSDVYGYDFLMKVFYQ